MDTFGFNESLTPAEILRTMPLEKIIHLLPEDRRAQLLELLRQQQSHSKAFTVTLTEERVSEIAEDTIRRLVQQNLPTGRFHFVMEAAVRKVVHELLLPDLLRAAVKHCVGEFLAAREGWVARMLKPKSQKIARQMEREDTPPMSGQS